MYEMWLHSKKNRCAYTKNNTCSATGPAIAKGRGLKAQAKTKNIQQRVFASGHPPDY
jgi:hypothetical protein